VSHHIIGETGVDTVASLSGHVLCDVDTRVRYIGIDPHGLETDQQSTGSSVIQSRKMNLLLKKCCRRKQSLDESSLSVSVTVLGVSIREKVKAFLRETLILQTRSHSEYVAENDIVNS